ncbi:hypothetical protein [Nocardia sp. NPDC051463]|uniref:hypothetical protein n=1 Tax=Nocardia sp. NPDC051463 TaxID=3154845 RepID=UPI00344F2E66
MGFRPRDRLDVHASAIALGHPVGATGLHITTTMPHELVRTEGALRARSDRARPRPRSSRPCSNRRRPRSRPHRSGPAFTARPRRFGRHPA